MCLGDFHLIFSSLVRIEYGEPHLQGMRECVRIKFGAACKENSSVVSP